MSNNEHIDIARDLFLVGCYTAQRFSDYSTINEGNIRTLESGQRVIDLKQQKTGNHVVIPVRPELQAILDKYENRLPKAYEQKVNKFIKEVAREAGIAKARELYTNAHKDKADEIASWDDTTFLNKAKITIRGKITNTAIVLLGKEESEHLITPAVAKIKWILRGQDNIERDYMIASCPFILAVDRIYDKIRNLKYRYINPELKTLFPEEIDTYEPYVIREALNNAIAHQDYTLGGQINVVEYDDKLVFSNKGSFIPGNIERVLVSDAPEERYRNQFLVTAMVGLKMVDTIGSGIRKMYNYQRQRLFPLLDCNLANNRVEVTITGKILGQYSGGKYRFGSA